MKILLILLTLSLTGCGRNLFTERQGDSGLSEILKNYGR